MRAGYLIAGVGAGGSGFGGGGAGGIDQSHDLLLAYDQSARIVAYAIEKRRLFGGSMTKHARDWRSRAICERRLERLQT
ncbi:MAG TPA: hypothetical protein VJ484_07555 [Lysobacter sp.]|nr:hypothetical protein [Lysobacter sp.]